MKDTELKEARDIALYKVYKEGLVTHTFGTMHEAIDWCRLQPAPCFFLSAKRLSNYITLLQCGHNLNSLHPSTRKKVKHLYARYIEFKTKHPLGKEMSRNQICELLVEEPAPEFYIGWRHALRIIRKEQSKQWGRY